MGSYRGKVTDNVLDITPNTPNDEGYGIDNYEDFSNSSQKKYFSKLKYYLDELLDNSDLQNLLYFDDEKFIQIKYNEKYITNSNFKIAFNFDKIKEKWEIIKLKNENHIFDFEYSNIYIAFGLVKYDEYLIPLSFIPVDFIEKGNQVIFNPSFDIVLNYCLEEELYDIDFPSYKGNLIEYINKIDAIKEVQFLKKAFIGNFDLNSIYYCNDLDSDWPNSVEKYELFFKNKYLFDSTEVISLNNKLAVKWPDLNLKLNKLNMGNVSRLIKNLLANHNSILIISDNEQRTKIKHDLSYLNLDHLILDYSNISENNFYELISDFYLINTEFKYEFDKLNGELTKLEECLDVTNRKYSQLNLYPKEIKQLKNKYYTKIKDIPHDFPIKNATTYKFKYINKLKRQLIDKINYYEIKGIELYLTDDYFNSIDYNIIKSVHDSFENNLNTFIDINNEINKIYGIKKFENLNEVKYLKNLGVLKGSTKFIDEIDRSIFNNLLKMKLNSGDYKEEFASIFTEYEIDENNIETIENYIKYSELIENNIFDDETLIRNNISVIIKDLETFYDINSYLFKQLDYIHDFYNVFKCFKRPSELLNSKISLADVKNIINIFKHDFKRLEKYKDIEAIDDIDDVNINNYFKLWKSGEIKTEFLGDVFSYNFYDSILNNFLNDFKYIDEERLSSTYYEDRYNELTANIKKIERKQFKQSIYLKLKELNQRSNVKEQKEDWELKIAKGKSIPLNSILRDYKDYIFSNQPIFMINFYLIPIIFDKSFENYFDYVLFCPNDFYDKTYHLSALIRSKNKLITVGKGV